MTQNFSSFGLPAKLLHALERMKFSSPTPIQALAIPLGLQGRDILGSAQTGTGKTAAFGIPLIARMMEDPEAHALVLTPTRELAAQVLATLQQIIPVPDIKTALLIGGESMPRQLRQLDLRPRLIVGTPGRINDHLVRGSLKLKKTSLLVLDETDRMLDMGFGVQLDKIIAFLPDERQTMMFSATLPNNIINLSRKYLNDPERIAVGSTTQPGVNIKQELVQTSEGDKYKNLMIQLQERTGSIIIFVKTKYGTQRLADKLTRDGHAADAIHGDLQQKKRDRVIQAFRDKKYRILAATDVAARGLDIPHIEHVINYDLPQVPEDYIHRIGRTARAGAAGSAVNLITPADGEKWRAIHRLMQGEDVSGDTRSFSKGRKKGGGAGHSGSKKPDFKKRDFKKGGFKKDFKKKDFREERKDEPASFSSPQDRFKKREDKWAGDKADRKPAPFKRREEGASEGRPQSRFSKQRDDKWTDEAAGDRKARPRSDDRPFGDRKPGGFKKREDRDFGDRRRDEAGNDNRKPAKFGERKPDGFKKREDRPFGDRKPGSFKKRDDRDFGDRKRDGDDRKPERKFGERKPDGFKKREDRPFGDRKPAGFKKRDDRDFGDRKRDGDDRKPAKFGERKPDGFKKREDRPFGDRKPDGFKKREDRPFGDRKPGGFKSDDRKAGDRPKSKTPGGKTPWRNDKPGGSKVRPSRDGQGRPQRGRR
jgi:ATP-dependent RNA helicase DeaD